MKLYTKTGDDGTTGLFGGTRVPKHETRVEAYGDIDETNAAIGVAKAESGLPPVQEVLTAIQSDLFTIGAILATPAGHKPPQSLDRNRISWLEQCIDTAVEKLPPLSCFILPSGTKSAATLHLARGVCRRGERSVTRLATTETVDPLVLVYLNRLSDLLFALARQANHADGCPDSPWQSGS